MAEAAPGRAGRPSGGPAWLDGAVGWLSGRKPVVLAAAAGLQIVILLAMILLRALPLLTGESVLIRVVPVDPRDLLRGDYVVLGYAFSQVASAGIAGLPQATLQRGTRDWQGRTVYVSLVPEADGRHWRAEKIGVDRPAAGRYILGRIAAPGRLEFGIEAFYVQEGMGRAYEQAARERRLSAEVALTSGGQAALRGLRIE